MFLHRLSHNAKLENVFHWLIMAMSAGTVNVGGFLVTGRFVTHVTGFATLFGAEVGMLKWNDALRILSVPLFFLLGAFAAGWCIDRQIMKRRPPHFDWVMVMSGSCLIIAAFLPHFEQRVHLGEMTHLRSVYFLLVLLCFSSGLQNAALTSSSGSSVRTTHLTGLTTDLGLGLARLLYEPFHPLQMKDELRTTWIRLGTILMFIFGSTLGAWLYLKVGQKSFLLAALINMYAALHGRRAKIHAHRSEAISP